MADAESTVALNIGSQQISMAVFDRSKKGGLVLKKLDSTSILADPAAEMARLAQLQVAVGDLAKNLKVPKTGVRYAISGQSVFTRFIKLPPIEEDNIDQLVAFEAQQHVPFPIDEVIWDWTSLEASGTEKEVVLVAIKADQLNEINEAVKENGLSTTQVDASPMALYNAFRFNYPEEQESVLLIDIGAKATNLVYIEGARVFTRSLNIGGAAVTAAIAKEYGVSFAEAETQKVTNGLVALGGGHTEQLDEATAGLASTIRNALTRLPSEIARTNTFYRTQHEGNPPTKAYLAGGGANMPYMREFLEEKLRMPIEFFNPLARVSIAKNLDTDALAPLAHTLGELVGLGLSGIGKAKLNIDLVPGAVQSARDAARRKPFLLTATLVLIVGLGAWAAFKIKADNRAKEEAAVLASTVGDLKPFADDLKILSDKAETLSRYGLAYSEAQNQREGWIHMLNELKTHFASTSVWVTDFQPLIGNDIGKPDTGKSAVKDGFPTTAYGSSSLGSVQVKEGETLEINAVRLTGLWRNSVGGHEEVNKIIRRIRDGEEAGLFNLQIKDDIGHLLKTNKLRLMTDKEIVESLEISGTGDALGATFKIVLPFKKSIPLK